MKLSLPRIIPKMRSAGSEFDNPCGTCHLIGKCATNDSCAIWVKYKAPYGEEGECLCWPSKAEKQAA